MTYKSIGGTVLVLLIILGGVWWFFGYDRGDSTPAFTSVATGIHHIGNNQHIIEGMVTLPNPCHELSANVEIRESFPEQVLLRFDSRQTADVCVETAYEESFRVTFIASPEAVIEATLNGEPLALTLETRSFVTAPLTEEFTLAFDEEKRVDDLPIRFLRIEEENRCPADAECIQAGRVVLMFAVAEEEITLALPGGEQIPNAAVVGSYLITLTVVNPTPVLEEQFSDDQYTATLRVELIDTKG
ncbi:MAG: hypothetical protein COU90_02385 [Candidatus Ryanbacteria bacterium CG10_big_fil_rev_8_21_14_0_10_43_42]|uniref:Uncharacterized protein n=1 Tax=Candidatus Ryanbacteria bacterium CG10_big_fil_rev_8_21_14_0_10_43_42 TaxID=1974864 RepID=A0A2M8KXK4_9BACT|nr:MAG: hypothetical protein COU90_02385 [Candidatus Ryanbacteria bacterium CG10_big_fil_rev_8_21_14_0_10_43_42]